MLADNLPIYNILDGDIQVMSIVDEPAVEHNFLCFSKDNKEKVYKRILNFNNENRVITGLALIADTPIYRNDKLIGPHYVIFTKRAIKKIVLRFFKEGKNNLVNINHDKQTSGICIFESYIVNKYNKLFIYNEEIPEGSWIVSYSVENPEVYNMIKDGKINGFSVEGMFSYSETPINTVDPLDELLNDLL